MRTEPVISLDTVDSTNLECRRRAALGAPDGLVVTAACQTAGRGRMGRAFQSLPDKGLYLSLLLRPSCSPEALMTLTPRAAVAACDAISAVTGLTPGIKWPNDLILRGKKLCGILTELGTGPSGQIDYAILGIGVNLTQTPEDFGPELSPIAISLAQVLDHPPARETLTQALLTQLDRLRASFPGDQDAHLARYRALCLTPGREVLLLPPEGPPQPAYAEAIGDDFSLTVRLPDGSHTSIRTGEVSVRGLEGYV